MTSSGVQRRCDFIEEHDLRAHGQGPGDGHTLLLATGQAGRKLLPLVAQTHLRQQLIGDLLGLGPGELLDDHQAFNDVSQGGPVRPKIELLKDHPHLGLNPPQSGPLDPFHAAVPLDSSEEVALQINPSAEVLLQVGKAPKKGALSGAGRPDDAEHLPPRHIQMDAAKDFERPELLAEVLHPDDGFTHCHRSQPPGEVDLRPPGPKATGKIRTK